MAYGSRPNRVKAEMSRCRSNRPWRDAGPYHLWAMIAPHTTQTAIRNHAPVLNPRLLRPYLLQKIPFFPPGKLLLFEAQSAANWHVYITLSLAEPQKVTVFVRRGGSLSIRSVVINPLLCGRDDRLWPRTRQPLRRNPIESPVNVSGRSGPPHTSTQILGTAGLTRLARREFSGREKVRILLLCAARPDPA